MLIDEDPSSDTLAGCSSFTRPLDSSIYCFFGLDFARYLSLRERTISVLRCW